MIRRLLLHISRWGQSHGFGVQSPFAFNFIKDVVRETWPYYFYEPLAAKYKENKAAVSLHRFYLRLSNMLQAKVWISPNAIDVVKDYIKAGCIMASFYPSHTKPDAIYIDLSDCSIDYKCLYGNIKSNIPTKGVMVLENIYCNDESKLFWHTIVNDPSVGVTFDLYDCGVAFFNVKMPKHNYKVILK